MRTVLMLAAAAAALGAAGAASAAAVEVRDAVARVTVIPENRSDIKVEVIQANPRLPIEVRTFAGQTVVDGGLHHRVYSCRGRGDNISVRVRGVGEVGWREMPQIVIHTPRDVDLDAGDAVWGSVGRSASLRFGNAGCGDWTVANVEGPMRISEAGSGDTHAGSAGAATIRVGGSGDIWVGEVKGKVDVSIGGSGDVTVASVEGSLDVHVAGSGDVRVASGHATTMDVTVAGSGDVRFGGVADTLRARIAGSGDVRARQVTGSVSKTVMGSGSVSVGE